jgi:acetyltransferase-like isoleucine patch superfamily enzyme
VEQLRELKPYSDEKGNVVIYEGKLPPETKVDVKFRGTGNVLTVAKDAKVVELTVDFAGDDGKVVIGGTPKPRIGLRLGIRAGHSSVVTVGSNIGCETKMFISASEGASVTIGDDCMISSGIELRTDDSHAIYDVRSGKRVNPARSIHIGEHVWLGKSVIVMGGVSIGSGSVIGFRSIVTKNVPNNAVAAGAPARVVRRDIAWERPMVAYRVPGLDGLGPGEAKNARYWNLTAEEAE